MTAKKRRFPAFIFSFIIFLAALVLLFFAFQKAKLQLGSFLQFTGRRQSVSWSVLEEIRDIKELETASYTLKSVFPYDFVDAGTVDWSFLQLQYDRSPSLFLEKTHPSWHPGGRVPDEWNGAEIYALCRQAGIDPGRPDYRFLVISTELRAGIDFDVWLGDLGEQDERGEVPGIRISTREDGSKELRLEALPVEIMSFIVEDRDTAVDGFPDVPLSPDRWRILVEALEPRLMDLALENGLLEVAEEQGRAFISEIFMAAGYQHVLFE